ncbi:MAG: sigma-70 family RNA polymerase sigma factor, partial [Candidatus Pacearchaeota archaeon]
NEENLKKIKQIAESLFYKINGPSFEIEDLISSGKIGLIKAAKNYHSKKYNFEQYSSFLIKYEMFRTIREDYRDLKIPYYTYSLNKDLNKLERGEIIKNERESLEEICDILNLSVKKKKYFLRMTSFRNIVSNYEPFFENEKEEYFDNFYNDLDRKLIFEELNKYLKDERLLTKREKEVIKKRYGFERRIYTFQEIGDFYGISRQRAKSIEKSAINKLRNKLLKEKKLSKFL